MAVGYLADKATIDNRTGQLVQTLRETFTGINRAKLFLDSLTDPNLTALGYSAGDITLLRASMTDLENLRLTAIGSRTQPSASNFFFNADKLTGIV